MVNKHWAQQPIFAERIREFCRKNGYLTKNNALQFDVVADLFNLHEDSLRQFMQNSSRKRPHLTTLTFIASVIGCSVAEFLDMPESPVPSITHERWASLTERERGIVATLVTEIASDDLTLVEREGLLKIFLDAKETLLRIKKKADN